MDSKQLKSSLTEFVKECNRRHYPLTALNLRESFPGCAGTSFFVEVSAPWFKNISISEALDILFEILWDTTTVAIRTSIFTFKILYDNEVSSNPNEESVTTNLLSS